MLESEKLAIAAHLHVLLRRKTGRVTDTEWMAANADYAREIMRFARSSAREDGHPDLAEWADKLESVLGLGEVPAPARRERPGQRFLDSVPGFSASVPATDEVPAVEAPRYVRGIR